MPGHFWQAAALQMLPRTRRLALWALCHVPHRSLFSSPFPSTDHWHWRNASQIFWFLSSSLKMPFSRQSLYSNQHHGIHTRCLRDVHDLFFLRMLISGWRWSWGQVRVWVCVHKYKCVCACVYVCVNLCSHVCLFAWFLSRFCISTWNWDSQIDMLSQGHNNTFTHLLHSRASVSTYTAHVSPEMDDAGNAPRGWTGMFTCLHVFLRSSRPAAWKRCSYSSHEFFYSSSYRSTLF